MRSRDGYHKHAAEVEHVWHSDSAGLRWERWKVGMESGNDYVKWTPWMCMSHRLNTELDNSKATKHRLVMAGAE